MTDLKFPIDNFEIIEEDTDTDTGKKQVILRNVDMVRFMETVWNDETVTEFLSHPDILDMFAKRIGVKGLFRAYKKEEVCDELTWEYIKDYFIDHVEPSDIFSHFGWEAAAEHFKDHLEGNETAEEDINSSKSVAEKLNNACEEQD